MVKTHNINQKKIAELCSDQLLISGIEDGVQLAGEFYYQNYHGIILHDENIIPGFFDLRSGIAGEILQKFSNFGMSLAIIGNFKGITSESMQAFITESNRQGKINFVANIDEALNKLSV